MLTVLNYFKEVQNYKLLTELEQTCIKLWYKYGFFSIMYDSEDNIDWENLFADSN